MEIVSKIKSLSDAELCKKLLAFRSNEREALSDLLLHLCELDRRKGYLDLGYGSLFAYLRNALGYSESETYRRIAGARVLKETPDVYVKLRIGKLTLSALNEIAKVKDGDTQRALLSSAEGQSTRAIERLVAEHLPATAQKKERVRARKVAPPAPTPLLDSQVVDHTPSAPKVMYSTYMELDEETVKLATEVKADLAPFLLSH